MEIVDGYDGDEQSKAAKLVGRFLAVTIPIIVPASHTHKHMTNAHILDVTSYPRRPGADRSSDHIESHNQQKGGNPTRHNRDTTKRACSDPPESREGGPSESPESPS